MSEAEINRVLAIAEHGRQENSDVFHNSMDSLLTQTSFDHWDLNRDDLINSDEVKKSIWNVDIIVAVD